MSRNYFKKYNTITGWIVFAVAAIVYLLTIEPSSSLWDCSEFIATSYKLEVGHPPGAPLFMIIARFFTIFAPNPGYAAMMVNSMSALASAFTILFLFWSITHLGRRILGKQSADMTTTQSWTVLGAGIVGALAYTFTDTFWFSAVEAEVYALSSLFTAVVVWAMLRWEEVADEPHANRWLILIAYLMGLSIGVHILNLLAIPAIVFIYYFKKTDKVTFWGVIKATAIAGAILLAINNIIIPYTAAFGAVVDRWFVNGLGMPVNSGLLIFVLILFTAVGFGIYITHKRGMVIWNTIILCLAVILIGYSSYASVVIRAEANPPMNSNKPDNAYGLLYLLNRDQYGNKPLVFGAQYSAPIEEIVMGEKYYVDGDGKYIKEPAVDDYKFPAEFITLFPRMWSSSEYHVAGYKQWGKLGEGDKIMYRGENVSVPTTAENLRYFFSYQLNFMYWRYFLWNFVGRQSDNQSMGEVTDGQWLSGIKAIDSAYLGPQDGLPSEMKDNKGRNTYLFLPFILGIIGLIYQLNRDPKNFTVVMWFFFMMGIALVMYFNTTPSEPRERDYVYAGSFYAFCIWIGLGVMCIKEWIDKLAKKETRLAPIAATVICSCVPIILAAQNWDDHDRSHRYVARDIGYNHLQTCLPNSIIMNYGDNDTFPLWYNQEVEGVRPDVRIMNMSYLAGGWYVDEMKYRYNESAPVPFSLPQHKYMYQNDRLFVEDMFNGEAKTIKQVMNFVRDDDPRTRVQLQNMSLDFIPTKTILLPVNKENVLKTGVVKPEDAHLMVDTIVMNIKATSIDKTEMMLLDLLANFNWERPLYFTTTSLVSNIGLEDYLQFDGYAYRLVPIKSTYEENGSEMGRIDTDVLYNNLMNVYRYGNVSDPRVYVDSYTNYNFNAVRVRVAFARLADALSARGEREKAIEVLDYGLEQMPVAHFQYTYQYLPYIRAYYNAGAMEKGDKLLTDYANNLQEYADYYISFPSNKGYLVEGQTQEKLMLLADLHRIADTYDRKDISGSILTYFNNIFGDEEPQTETYEEQSEEIVNGDTTLAEE